MMTIEEVEMFFKDVDALAIIAQGWHLAKTTSTDKSKGSRKTDRQFALGQVNAFVESAAAVLLEREEKRVGAPVPPVSNATVLVALEAAWNKSIIPQEEERAVVSIVGLTADDDDEKEPA